MSIFKIALTGGIACGKSSVGRIFEKMAVPIIDLDAIAKQIVKPNTHALSELVSKFGTNILHSNQTLNREKLRQKLVESPSNQHLIEQILHPKILKKMQTEIEALDAKLVIVEVPLLAKQNLSHLFDRAIVVDCSEENQLKRLLKRNHINQALAKKMVSAQASRKQHLALDKQLPIDIIENNASMLSLEKKVRSLAETMPY